jgi:hypothetical protein
MSAPKPPRTLVVRNWDAGFFSNFNGVLNNLHWRLGRDGIEAVAVDWRANLNHPHFGYGAPSDGDLWSRFFAALPFESFPHVRVETDEYADLNMTGGNAYAMYRRDRRWRRAYHALYRKYIHINRAIADRADAISDAQMAGRYCIGVHVRHPQHAIECPDPAPDVDTFIEQVRQLLPAEGVWAVVLATDIEPAVAAFRQAFGDRLVVQPDVLRAASVSDGQLHQGKRLPSVSSGVQVLVDCLLLSRCDVLVHVTSNIATAAGYINPDLKMVYCESRLQAAVSYLRCLLPKSRLSWE